MKIKQTITSFLIASAAVMFAIVFKASVNAQGDSGGGVPAKSYHCVMYAGGQLITVASLTITGPGTYTDRDGKKGTYTFDSSSSTVTFHGGNYNDQNAEYDSKTRHIHILGPSGRRVIECD